MSSRGLFITIEGGEGVGKSTNIHFLQNYLADKGVQLVTSREPGGTTLGEEMRQVLLNPRTETVADTAELLLMFAARAQHIAELIEPALAAGQWVLCDRFTDATYAYQCGGRGVPEGVVSQLEELVQGELRPDFTLLFDLDVSTGMERARGRGALDRIEHEDISFFERVRATYLARAEMGEGRFRIVDAGLPLESVQRHLASIGDELLGCWMQRNTPS